MKFQTSNPKTELLQSRFECGIDGESNVGERWARSGRAQPIRVGRVLEKEVAARLVKLLRSGMVRYKRFKAI